MSGHGAAYNNGRAELAIAVQPHRRAAELSVLLYIQRRLTGHMKLTASLPRAENNSEIINRCPAKTRHK